MRSINTDDAGVFRLMGLLVSDTMQVVARALEPSGATLRFDAPGLRFTTPAPKTARADVGAWTADAQNRQMAWPSFYRDSTARQLAEVVVKASKITPERSAAEQQASIHGEADNVFVPKNANDYPSLETMLSQVPGMSQLLNRNYSSFGDNSPLYLLDGVIIDRDRLKDVLGALSPTEVSRVELLKNAGAAIYGARAANGVIAIYTKKEGELQLPERTSVATTVTGFTSPREFYVPRYETADVSPRADRRDVLFWQPLGESGPDGLANLVFPLNDTAKRLRIVVQGISSEGVPISFVWLLPVR